MFSMELLNSMDCCHDGMLKHNTKKEQQKLRMSGSDWMGMGAVDSPV